MTNSAPSTRDRILKVLADTSCYSLEEVSQIPGDAPFFEPLGLDSLDEVEAVMHLENEFDIILSDDIIENNQPLSFDKLESIINSLVATNGG
jgi:acyl carrier protein